jgi:hypothetical protein
VRPSCVELDRVVPLALTAVASEFGHTCSAVQTAYAHLNQQHALFPALSCGLFCHLKKFHLLTPSYIEIQMLHESETEKAALRYRSGAD